MSELSEALRRARAGMSAGSEALMTIGSGVLAQPLAGIGGIGRLILSGGDIGKSRATIDALQDALTYQPKTKEGLETVQTIVKPFEMLDEHVIQPISDKAYEMGGPVAGAAVNTALNVVDPFKGKGKAIQGALRRAVPEKSKSPVPDTTSPEFHARLDMYDEARDFFGGHEELASAVEAQLQREGIRPRHATEAQYQAAEEQVLNNVQYKLLGTQRAEEALAQGRPVAPEDTRAVAAYHLGGKDEVERSILQRLKESGADPESDKMGLKQEYLDEILRKHAGLEGLPQPVPRELPNLLDQPEQSRQPQPTDRMFDALEELAAANDLERTVGPDFRTWSQDVQQAAINQRVEEMRAANAAQADQQMFARAPQAAQAYETAQAQANTVRAVDQSEPLTQVQRDWINSYYTPERVGELRERMQILNRITPNTNSPLFRALDDRLAIIDPEGPAVIGPDAAPAPRRPRSINDILEEGPPSGTRWDAYDPIHERALKEQLRESNPYFEGMPLESRRTMKRGRAIFLNDEAERAARPQLNDLQRQAQEDQVRLQNIHAEEQQRQFRRQEQVNATRQALENLVQGGRGGSETADLMRAQLARLTGEAMPRPVETPWEFPPAHRANVQAFLDALRNNQAAFEYPLAPDPSLKSMEDIAAHYSRPGKEIGVTHYGPDDYDAEPKFIDEPVVDASGRQQYDANGRPRFVQRPNPDYVEPNEFVGGSYEIEGPGGGILTYDPISGGLDAMGARGRQKGRGGGDAGGLYQVVNSFALANDLSIPGGGLTPDNQFRLIGNQLATAARHGKQPRFMGSVDRAGTAIGTRQQLEGPELMALEAANIAKRMQRQQLRRPDAPIPQVEFTGTGFKWPGEQMPVAEGPVGQIKQNLTTLSPNVSSSLLGPKTLARKAIFDWLGRPDVTPQKAKDVARTWDLGKILPLTGSTDPKEILKKKLREAAVNTLTQQGESDDD